MSHDLFSSLDSFVSVSSSSLLVRDATGTYQPAEADEVLAAVQRVLASRVRGANVLTSLTVVKDFLRTWLGALPHKVSRWSTWMRSMWSWTTSRCSGAR